jgi:hypothetical protein
VSPPNAYGDIPIPVLQKMIVFGDKAFKEELKLKLGH